MRHLVLMTLPLLASACATVPGSTSALCTGLQPHVDRHAVELARDGVPDAVVVSGERLVAGFDAGCP